MSSSNKLTFARLLDWIEGRLTEEEASVVAAQIAEADPETQADLDWLQAFSRLSAASVLASPPPEMRDLLVRRFEAYAQDRRQPGFWQRLVAAVTFDSNLQLAMAGLRATSAQASVRQLIYATDVADIALNIQPRPQDKHLDVNGQVFPHTDAIFDTFSVQLLRGTTEVGLTSGDELGEFNFEAIPTGVYDLILSTDQIEILIAPIELKM